MRLTMLSRAFFALLFAAAAGWESGKTCTTDDAREEGPHLIDLDLRGNIISRGVSVGDHMGELPPPIQWDGPDGQYYQ